MIADTAPTKEYWTFAATKRSWMVNINPQVYQNGNSELRWLYANEQSSDAQGADNA